MPTTRRSTGRSASTSNKQSTLSFQSRVTKSSVTKSVKNDLLASGKVASSPLAKEIEQEPEEVPEEEKVILEQEKSVEASPEPEAEKSEAELRAQQITDRQITKYWNGVEAERKAKRVHQQDLNLAEKVLRYFDVSSQYGVSGNSWILCSAPVFRESHRSPLTPIHPLTNLLRRIYEANMFSCTVQPCVGISRMKRWKRAEKLGLNPPVEVLAVLLMEEEKGTKGIQAAHMDYILNSTAVGVN